MTTSMIASPAPDLGLDAGAPELGAASIAMPAPVPQPPKPRPDPGNPFPDPGPQLPDFDPGRPKPLI